MNRDILKLLCKNAKYTAEEIAVMLAIKPEEAKAEIEEMENEGLIRGYKAIIDWDKLDKALVSAIIELKVTPKAGRGFEEIAEHIMKYPEVESVYLMSGSYDLHVVVKGKTFQQVAMFVAKELAPIESVISTSTHFMLRRYKEFDVELVNGEIDDRGNYIL